MSELKGRMSKTPEQHAASCAERAILDYNNEVIGKGRDINQLFIGCFMEGFLVGRRAGLPDKIHMKVWWKCSDIGLAFKGLLWAFGLRNRYGRDYRSSLHKTLEAYLNDEKK